MFISPIGGVEEKTQIFKSEPLVPSDNTGNSDDVQHFFIIIII